MLKRSPLTPRSRAFRLLCCSSLVALATILTGCDSGQRTVLGEMGGGSPSAAGTGNDAAGTAAAGGANGGSANGGGAGMAPTAGAATGSLAAKYKDFFPIGVAVSEAALSELSPVLLQDFNHLTCEYQMKIAQIHPAEATYDWDATDNVANFARQNGMKLTGHTLLWHQDAPAWMFEGVTAGDTQSLELLKARLKAHIDAVVDRYADVVSNWDVVNEALSDDATKQYRDGAERSMWFEAFGSEEYIYWAFKYAKDALEAKTPGSSAGKLYYNEYTETTKADKMLKLLAWLKEKGITIDGVGFQSHVNMTWPTTGELQIAIDKFKAAGYKVKISELDVTVYSDYATGMFVPSPAVEFTPELEAKQAKRYADLFALYRKNKDQITSVTIWGVADDQSWLNTLPVPDRPDFPLLYSTKRLPKAARAAIMEF